MTGRSVDEDKDGVRCVFVDDKSKETLGILSMDTLESFGFGRRTGVFSLTWYVGKAIFGQG